MSTVRKLRDLAIVAAGQGAPQGEENYCTNGIPFIKAGNLIELLNGKKERDIQNVSEEVAKQYRLKLYPAGTVLFAKSGMSCMKGYVYVLQSDCYVVSHLACIIPIETTGAYLKYYFEYHRPNSLIKDEAYPSISLSDIGNLDIRLETPVKQAAIVNNLDRINALIKCRKAQLHKIDDLVKSQFIEMFGGYSLRDKQPHWRKIGNVAEVVGGSTPKTEKREFWGGNNCWITPAEIDDDSFIVKNTVRRLTDEGVKSCSLKRLPIGTVLLSSRAPIGKVAIAGVEMYCNQGFKNLICGQSLNSIYTYYLLKFNSEYLNSLGRGATFKEISKAIVDNIAIPVPEMERQNQFAAFVEQTDKSKVLMEQARKLVQILIKLILNIGTIEKSIQICYNGHRKEGV